MRILVTSVTGLVGQGVLRECLRIIDHPLSERHSQPAIRNHAGHAHAQ